MGRALVETHPIFRSTIRRLDVYLSALYKSPLEWTIEGKYTILYLMLVELTNACLEELLRPANAS